MFFATAASAVLTTLVVAVTAQAPPLTPKEELGKAIFFDKALSVNGNQSCATCHDPKAGWVGPDSQINGHGAVYGGSIPGAFGDRKPPSAAYATQSPVLYLDEEEGLWVGGNFWDGRATGERLGSPAAEQALGPFLNPAEQALSTPGDVVTRVCKSSYGGLFKSVWGQSICDPANVSAAYDNIGYSIAAYEASSEVNAFSSKFDFGGIGRDKLQGDEKRGQKLFNGVGKCSQCHLSDGQKPLFTDYTFDNLGIPKNSENPVYAKDPDFIDQGLGGFLASLPAYAAHAADNMGKHKVPTLRNVDLRAPGVVKAYGHNGYFKSLEGIVHFYNTRDIKPVCPGPYTEAQALAENCWPEPEVAENVNDTELGNLGLKPKDEADIVAFLKTLSDGYVPKK
jgi:cytochrome c peroxidase